MYFWSDDPHRDFDRHQDHLQKQLEKLPKCGYCKEPIQDDEAYVVKGKCYCEECWDNYHRIKIADYIR